MTEISYAQRYEDLHLMRCFEGQRTGFYIDIGAGHPVYDNVSFAFYLKDWSGITVEPNPWLAELSAAVRPRDHRIQSLVGKAPGEATYYLIEHFHGLSTTVESNARTAQREFGKPATAMPVAVTTLAALCAEYAPAEIDFLKIDVEGAEPAVLAGNDWTRYRPKIVTAEAVAPVTMEPSWQAWEPILTSNGYRFAFSDGLNRYYVAAEHAALADRLAASPPSFDGVTQLRNLKPALDDAGHPDHRLAKLLAGMDMVRLPLLATDELVERLVAGIPATELDAPASVASADAIHRGLLGTASPSIAAADVVRGARLRDVYRRMVDSESFRAACGRISASYAW